MPTLPATNRDVVAFWWEDRVLKQEKLPFTGFDGVIGRMVFKWSAKA
jgi:hypothetical protein